MNLWLPSGYCWAFLYFLQQIPTTLLRCICCQVIDHFGNHLLGCSYDSTLLKRHNALCDIMWHALLSDNKFCRKEQNCSANHRSHPVTFIIRTFLILGTQHFSTSLSAIHCNHVFSALLLGKLVQPEMLEKGAMNTHTLKIVAVNKLRAATMSLERVNKIVPSEQNRSCTRVIGESSEQLVAHSLLLWMAGP